MLDHAGDHFFEKVPMTHFGLQPLKIVLESDMASTAILPRSSALACGAGGRAL